MDREKKFYNERNSKRRRLVSEFVAGLDDQQLRSNRTNREKVFSQFFIGWRPIWAEAFRIKESYGRHPSVLELLEFFLAESPDVPEDVVEARYRKMLITLQEMGLLLTTVGSVNGRVCQVLVNIKNPRITDVENESEENGTQNETNKDGVNLDEV